MPDDNLLPKEERDELGTNEGYVVITQQDIVDGVACFVARSISSLPQSKVRNLEKLQFQTWQQVGLFFMSQVRRIKLRNNHHSRLHCILEHFMSYGVGYD